MVHDRRTFGVVEALPLRQKLQLVQLVFEKVVSFIGEGRGALLFIERVVLFLDEWNDLVDGDIEIGPVLAGPEMISGVRASSIRIESTSSTIAKLWPRWAISSSVARMLSRR
jgi:hypothetical protein